MFKSCFLGWLYKFRKRNRCYFKAEAAAPSKADAGRRELFCLKCKTDLTRQKIKKSAFFPPPPPPLTELACREEPGGCVKRERKETVASAVKAVPPPNLRDLQNVFKLLKDVSTRHKLNLIGDIERLEGRFHEMEKGEEKVGEGVGGLIKPEWWFLCFFLCV